MAPPPICQALFLSFQVSLPGSPGAGITYLRQTSLPVLPSSAAIQSRTPGWPPAAPTMILSLTASGAAVSCTSGWSCRLVSHTTLPLSLSVAMTRAGADPPSHRRRVPARSPAPRCRPAAMYGCGWSWRFLLDWFLFGSSACSSSNADETSIRPHAEEPAQRPPQDEGGTNNARVCDSSLPPKSVDRTCPDVAPASYGR